MTTLIIKNLTKMSNAELTQRVAVLQVIKGSLEFSGRELPIEDKEKLAALRGEMTRREENNV